MTSIIHYALWCIVAFTVCFVAALDSLEAKGEYFVNPKTNKAFRVVGFDYSVSNDTSGAVDALSDPDACLRDAALMQTLNINAVHVSYVNPELDHDLCVSIFNGVGIYVAVGLEDHKSAWETAVPSPYTEDFLERSLAVVDAFKDYENLLAFYVADTSLFRNETFALLQPYMRAAVRDVKSYIANHASRKIPVGMRILFNEPPYTGALDVSTYASILHYASCSNSSDADDPSRVDFVGFWIQGQIILEQGMSMPPVALLSPLMALNVQSANSSVPVLMEGFRNTRLNTGVSSLDDLSPTDDWFIMPMTYDRMNYTRGLFMLKWANTPQFSDGEDWGHVDISTDTSTSSPVTTTRLRPIYDSLKSALENLDLGFARSGSTVESPREPPVCDSRDIKRFNTSWALPPTPAGVQSLIDYGIGGESPKGSVVPIPVNVNLTVLDSKGEFMSDLSIAPLPGTQVIEQEQEAINKDAPPEQGLSTSTKVGLGVAIPVAAIIFSAVAYLLFRRRRRQARAKASAGTDEKSHELYGNEKQELASPHNAHEAAAAEGDFEPRELDAVTGTYAPVELPAGDGRYGSRREGKGAGEVVAELEDSGRRTEERTTLSEKGE